MGRKEYKKEKSKSKSEVLTYTPPFHHKRFVFKPMQFIFEV